MTICEEIRCKNHEWDPVYERYICTERHKIPNKCPSNKQPVAIIEEPKKKIVVIVRDGILTDVRVDKNLKEKLIIEAVQVDKDYPDYEKLCEYENKIYENDKLYSANFTSVNFEEDQKEEE